MPTENENTLAIWKDISGDLKIRKVPKLAQFTARGFETSKI